jgi:tRNA A-37 threonylcarbamoyl transferase component Bud32
MLLQYLPGDRVLEWVLSRFSDNLDLADFQSFHGLMPPHNVDPRVAKAFLRFRESTSEEALQLKAAIRASYSLLHRIGIKHGSVDPRNVLYHADRVFIIDFDNARPSLQPSASDDEDLKYWYGV